MKGYRIEKPDEVFELLSRWKNRRQENFLVITLNGRHEIIKLHHVSKGLVNKTIIHPRECFFYAIKDYSTTVILVHNHPTGDCSPSSEDDDITARLTMVGELIGIRILDHIIISSKGFYSFRENGQIVDLEYDAKSEKYADLIAAENRGKE